MPPLTPDTALTAWQFAPLVSAVLAAFLALYLLCAARVRHRHPARPWPLRRTLAFLAGLAVVAVATQSSVGVYDDTLFSVHMVQHVLLIMAAPPLLISGRPVTLLLHSWGNPVHAQVKRAVRSRVVTALTWPPFATVLYCAVVAGTHTPPVMDLVLESEAVHDCEHVLYVAVGYVFFLPVLGVEPLRHRVSVIAAYLMLLIAMLADSATGIAYTFQDREVFAPYARALSASEPGLVTDLHLGGYVMVIGSDFVMTAIAIGLAARYVGADRRRPRSVGYGGVADLATYNEYLQALNRDLLARHHLKEARRCQTSMGPGGCWLHAGLLTLSCSSPSQSTGRHLVRLRRRKPFVGGAWSGTSAWNSRCARDRPMASGAG